MTTPSFAAALGSALTERPVRYARPPLPGWLVELALEAPELVDDDTLLVAEDTVLRLERGNREVAVKLARSEAREIVERLKGEGIDFGGEAGERETELRLTDLAVRSGDRARDEFVDGVIRQRYSRRAIRFTAVEPALPPEEVRAARFYVSQNPELYDRFGGSGQEVFSHALAQVRGPGAAPQPPKPRVGIDPVPRGLGLSKAVAAALTGRGAR
jgi:hypothetical protein